MKKHLFGFALFSFIFAVFAFIFAFTYVPAIPQVAEVNEKIEIVRPTMSSEKTSCFRNKNRKKISSEVVNSHYLFDENKIISEIKLVWNGSGEAPKKVQLSTMFSGLENKNENSFGTFQVLEEPFQVATEKTFTVVTKVSEGKISRLDNLYVVSSVFDYSNGESGSINKVISETKEVITIHGK